MKYTYAMGLSTLVVGLILITLVLLLNQLYQNNVGMIQRELNVVADSIYHVDLVMRLDPLKDTNMVNAPFSDSLMTPANSTKNAVTEAKEKSEGKIDALTLSTRMEDIANSVYPINLQRIDSLMQIVVVQQKIDLRFYSEIIDTQTGEIKETTWKDRSDPRTVLYSKNISLNKNQTKSLRLALVVDKTKIFSKIFSVFILSSLILFSCIIGIYGLMLQKKNLTRQKQLVDLKNFFFSEISHEFKRPLAVLLQTMDSFKNEKIMLDDDIRKHMLKIGEQEVAKMIGKTTMFLSLAMDDEGVLELYLSKFDLPEVVSTLVDAIVQTNRTRLDISIEDELEDPMIVGDKIHVEQIVSNLVSNAIKYSKDLSSKIDIRLYQENNNVCISIKDYGVGITEKNQEMIFDRYTRVGETGRVRGHGIGLNYVKRIVEKHGGRISVISQLNVGSEFIVKLPIINENN